MNVLVRRADVVAMIGAGLVFAAARWGHRRVAGRLGRPAGTVRGWMRRFRGRAEALRVGFIGLLVAVDPEPVLPCAAGTAVADAVVVVLAAAVATVRRWGEAVSGLSPWELAAAVSAGRLLSPTGTPMSINTSCPW